MLLLISRKKLNVGQQRKLDFLMMDLGGAIKNILEIAVATEGNDHYIISRFKK